MKIKCPKCGREFVINDISESFLCECGLFCNITKKGHENMLKNKINKLFKYVDLYE